MIGDSSNGLSYLLIEDEHGQRLLTATRLPSGPLPNTDSDILAALDRGILHQRQALLLSNNHVGLLQFGLATGGLLGVLQHMLRLVLLLNFAALLIASLAIGLFSHRLGLRLKHLMDATDALAAGDYQSRVHEQGHDELTRLADNFNRMAEAVTVREKNSPAYSMRRPCPCCYSASKARCCIWNKAIRPPCRPSARCPLVMAEFLRLWLNKPSTPDKQAYYLTVGHTFGNFTPYATYARQEVIDSINEYRLTGVPANAANALLAASNTEQHSYSLGVR